MELEISKILSSYINKKIDSKEFEKWVYSNENLKDEIGKDIYTRLISINYNDSQAHNETVKLIEDKINFGPIHRSEIIDLINNIEKKNH